ncbi:MAG: prepilin-type N-terminal cleavage/methylation domain-containing protein [Gammaproteobacteria bacterium]|nr:prepilin-type N-terminal cleavage/methylation domain-containing protein [Gammaproteobacteria bacterium]
MTTSQKYFESGFTLVELMIVLVLTIFLTGGAILIHLCGRAAYIDVEQLSHMQESIRFASGYMIRDLRNAGFRDEIFLRSGHEQQIRVAYATLLDEDEDGIEDTFRIRYAGRGHCMQVFDDFQLVENEYSLNSQTGELSCRGRTVARDDPGATQISAQAWSDRVGLVRGFTGIAFQRICPDGGSTCACDLVNDPDSSCIGVRVALQLRGMQALDGTASFDERSVELTVAFRNVILERMNTLALASES